MGVEAFPAHIANNGCLSRDGDIALKPFQLCRTSMPDYGRRTPSVSLKKLKVESGLTADGCLTGALDLEPANGTGIPPDTASSMPSLRP